MKTIRIYENEPIKELGDLYGLFFEDINHAADGGLYAEMVQNRSFEFCEIDRPEYNALTAWTKSDNLSWEVRTDSPLNNENSHYLHVNVPASASSCNADFHSANSCDTGSYAYIANDGFLPGIYVEAGKQYNFSAYVRCNNDAPKTLILKIVSVDNSSNVATSSTSPSNATLSNSCVCASSQLTVSGTSWTKYEVTLTATATTTTGKLLIAFDENKAANNNNAIISESYDFDMISLFPADTFSGIFRKDIALALKEMQPKFMRFPGGCLTHDGSLDKYARNSLYRWERTLGPAEARPTWRNNWGYNQTLGLGFYEYFCFCEEIGAQPLPVLAAGFNPHKGEGVPMEDMQEWVNEALHLIEFANGDETTEWGKIRTDLGHKKPFNLKYLGIGNEEIGDGFFERYPLYHHAIREKYPDIKLINTAGPFAVGEGYDAGWESAKKYGSDLVDEHYYSSPEWFLANMHHYDDFDVNGPHVFLGEYASWGNTFYNAIVEAAYMTGLEKAPAVDLACYAPMLCNAAYVNWAPDMLWFDNHRIAKTPNYYVQKLFMEHQGTHEIKYESHNLDEVIYLSDNKNISGKISIERNDIDGIISDIVLRDLTTGVDTHPDYKVDVFESCSRDYNHIYNFALNKDNPLITVGEISSSHYRLEFKFKRTAGRKGLKIFFGEKDPGNRFIWEFGGWDNWDCNLASIYNGRGATISHRIFHVEDIDYTLVLEVNGRNIKTYVNGVNWNNTTDNLPQIEELYISTSIDRERNTTILKAVNLTGEAKETEIILKHNTAVDSVTTSNAARFTPVAEHSQAASTHAYITELTAPSLTSENTLDNPNVVVPVTYEADLTVNAEANTAAAESNAETTISSAETAMSSAETAKSTLRHTFKPHSVTIIEFK